MSTSPPLNTNEYVNEQNRPTLNDLKKKLDNFKINKEKSIQRIKDIQSHIYDIEDDRYNDDQAITNIIERKNRALFMDGDEPKKISDLKENFKEQFVQASAKYETIRSDIVKKTIAADPTYIFNENGSIADLLNTFPEPRYCYCNTPDIGEMVACEGEYCLKEWFHKTCLVKKRIKISSEFYCPECVALSEKHDKIFKLAEELLKKK